MQNKKTYIVSKEDEKDILAKVLKYSPEIKTRENEIKNIFAKMPDIKIDGPIAVIDWLENYLLSLKK